MYNSITDTKVLSNSVKIPCVGAGVFKVDNTVTAQVVRDALEAGYRLIDTAAAYQNEEGVGEGLRQSAVKREDIFITTKLANPHHGYENTLKAFDESLRVMQLDYVDLYLIHWPIPRLDLYVETWRAFEQIYKSGKARAIGTSNFTIENLQRIERDCEIKPTLNQVEFHPFLIQDDLLQYMAEKNIALQAWSPLAKGMILTEPTIMAIAEKYGKSPVHVTLRWAMQRGALVIPKTIKLERMLDNANFFDFTLAESDIAAINALNNFTRTGPDPVTFG